MCYPVHYLLFVRCQSFVLWKLRDDNKKIYIVYRITANVLPNFFHLIHLKKLVHSILFSKKKNVSQLYFFLLYMMTSSKLYTSKKLHTQKLRIFWLRYTSPGVPFSDLHRGWSIIWSTISVEHKRARAFHSTFFWNWCCLQLISPFDKIDWLGLFSFTILKWRWRWFILFCLNLLLRIFSRCAADSFIPCHPLFKSRIKLQVMHLHPFDRFSLLGLAIAFLHVVMMHLKQTKKIIIITDVFSCIVFQGDALKNLLDHIPLAPCRWLVGDGRSQKNCFHGSIHHFPGCPQGWLQILDIYNLMDMMKCRVHSWRSQLKKIKKICIRSRLHNHFFSS